MSDTTYRVVNFDSVEALINANNDATKQALAAAGIEAQFISETTDDPPAGNEVGDKGAKRTTEGYWQRLEWNGSVWEPRGEPLLTTAFAPFQIQSVSEFATTDLVEGRTIVLNDPVRGGLFKVVTGETANDGVVFDIAGSKQAKRIFNGNQIMASWFGISGSGDEGAVIQSVCQYAFDNDYEAVFSEGTFNATSLSTLDLSGAGKTLKIRGAGKYKTILEGNDQNFADLVSSSVEIKNIGFDGFNRVLDLGNIAGAIDHVYIDSVYFNDSPTAGLVQGFDISTTKSHAVKDVKVINCEVSNTRHGIMWRPRATYGYFAFNHIHDIEAEAIRFGNDWNQGGRDGLDDQNESFIAVGNVIEDIFNPTVGFQQKAVGMSVFANRCSIMGNHFENFDATGASAGVRAESVYTKVRSGDIVGNTCIDAGRAEAAITLKTAPAWPDVGFGPVGMVSNVVNCSSNSIVFTKDRGQRGGIAIFRSNVNVSNNSISGAGVVEGAEKGCPIYVHFHSPYENIKISGNQIMNTDRAFGIHVWFYGKNIEITNNQIINVFDGTNTRGIFIETRASSDVRHPGSPGDVISENLVIEGNRIENVEASAGRGIHIGLHSESTAKHVSVRNNLIRNTGQHGISVSCTQTEHTDFNFIDNQIHDVGGTTLNFFTEPGNLRIRGNTGYITEANGIDSVGSSTTTKTVTTGLSRQPSESDISVTPRNSWGAVTQFWIADTFSGGNFLLEVDQASGGVGFRFSWKISVDRLLNPQ